MARLPARRVTAVALTVVALVVVPWAVAASDDFVDVPSSNVFGDDIAWLAQAGVTRGCNPPANTEFCPEEPVTRQQMAAFMHRLAEARVVDAATVEGSRASELGVTITGLAAADAIELPPLVTTAMGDLKLHATNGGLAQVTTAMRVAALAGVDVFTWVQANDSECELEKTPVLGSQASLPSHDWPSGSRSLHAHTVFVMEIEADTVLTFCARANIAAIPTVESFTMSVVQSHKGSFTLVSGSSH